MKLLRHSILLTVLFITACTDGAMPAPKTAAQGIFQLTSAYAAALKYEVAYAKLPRCSDTVPKPCSKTEVIKSVKRASDTTWIALQAAHKIVRTPGYAENLASTALSTANEALNAYIKITSTLDAGA